MGWLELKDYLSLATGLSEDSLHIYAAVIVQVAAALLLRRSVASPWPWLCVLATIVANEYFDIALYREQYGTELEQWQITGGIQDLWNTMLLPTILLLLCRYAPRLMGGARPTVPADSGIDPPA
jgi:hypothetical protein